MSSKKIVPSFSSFYFGMKCDSISPSKYLECQSQPIFGTESRNSQSQDTLVSSHRYRIISLILNSLPAKSCYGGEKHQNPIGFYCRNSTESTVHHKHNNPQHHHHGGAVCPSYGMGSMDSSDRTRVTSFEGFGWRGGVSVLINSINF